MQEAPQAGASGDDTTEEDDESVEGGGVRHATTRAFRLLIHFDMVVMSLELKLASTSTKSKRKLWRRRAFVLLVAFKRGFAVHGSSQPIASKPRSPVRVPGMDLARR